MTVLRTTVGAPGSGKTTDAIRWVNVDPTNRARINRDDLRLMLHGGYLGTREQEDQVTDVRDAGILKLLRRGISVVADDTNLRWGHLAHLQHIARRVRVEFEVVSYLHVDIHTCISRDASRKCPVGEDIIIRMWTNGLRNMIETWRSKLVDDLVAQEYAHIGDMITDAVTDPLDPKNVVVVTLARQYTDQKLAELAPHIRSAA